MYILKNAFRNIRRSIGRNILIGIITLVIAVSSCISLSIKHSAKVAEEDGINNLSITASISTDMEKIRNDAGNDKDNLRELMQNNGSLGIDELQKYATSKYVKDFTYTMQSSVSGNDEFEPYSDEEEESSSEKSNSNDDEKKPNMNGAMGSGRMGQQGDFTIVGYSSENAMTDFISGTNSIKEGKIFTFDKADNTCIISDTLASFNSLKTGDTITLTNPNLESETYTLTISGIYSTNKTSEDSMMRFSTSQNPINYIYTNYEVIKNITDTSSSSAVTSTDDNGNETTTALRSSVSGTYYLSNTENLESFKQDVKTMGLSDNYTVSSKDVENYEQSIVPLKNLSNFANVFLILVLLIGGIILIVLNIFNIRERKYEVGVLTAIGMKKSKVALQFITELFLVTITSIIIGTAVGAAASVPTANMLLESQVTSLQSQQESQSQNFGRQNDRAHGESSSSNKNINYIENIAASTDITVVSQLIGIGLLLTIISSCGAAVFILRYEPLKILSNRN